MSECQHDWQWGEQTQPSRGFYVFVCSLCDEVAEEEHFPEDDSA
jgi:predicted metal-binding protein